MTRLSRLLWTLPLVLLGCLSKSPPIEQDYYTLPLTALAGESRAGTTPLRLERVEAPPMITREHLWRTGANEVALDEGSAWAVHPADVLELRLRDLLFAREGFAESLASGTPQLAVRVLVMEGDATAARVARVELVADLWLANGTQYRRHFLAEAPLDDLTAGALAVAMGRAVEQTSAELATWVAANARR